MTTQTLASPSPAEAVTPSRRGLLKGGWSRSLGLLVAIGVLVLVVAASLAFGA